MGELVKSLISTLDVLTDIFDFYHMIFDDYCVTCSLISSSLLLIALTPDILLLRQYNLYHNMTMEKHLS